MTDRNGLIVRGESGRIGLAALLWSELWKTIANEQEETAEEFGEDPVFRGFLL